MAKPRIFISSTFYDLRQIRTDLDNFIKNLGYESIRNEEGHIPYGINDSLEKYCYKEIKSVDIVISIIGGRFGSESETKKASVSQLELKTAYEENKHVYIFIDKNVLSEYETYLLNKDNNMNCKYVDDKRIYEFIEEIKNRNINNNIKEFETASDITEYLKVQFAGLFQRFFEEQARTKEINIIRNLEKTSETLNKLVNFLSDKNEGQSEKINEILMINHPLIDEVRATLKIDYNFYIESVFDLGKLLKTRGYIQVTNKVHLQWNKKTSNQIIKIFIDRSIFDQEFKLKLIKRSEWLASYYMIKIEDLEEEEDDEFPF